MPGRLVERTWEHNPTIHAPAKYQRACKYAAFVPDSLSELRVTLDGAVAGLVSEAEQAIRSLNGEGVPALAPFARLLLRTESIASSKVEGMQLGVKELARAEAKVESGRNASRTAIDVLANIDAMVLAVDDASLVPRFGVAQITAIHKRLMERAENKHLAGVIRSQQNWIGGNDHNPCGADFVPPPAEEIDRLLTDLCDATNDNLLPPLVQAALVHAQFETIHPFEDGNGRTGRALVQVVLRRRGVAPRYVPPISVALAAGRERYIRALTSFRGDHTEGWIEYFASATATATDLARIYLKSIEQLSARWRLDLESLAGGPRAGAAAWSVIDVLPAHPIITPAVGVAATGRSRAAVYQALGQLQAAGILIPLSQSKRNRSWEAVGLLELISRFEAGQPPGQE